MREYRALIEDERFRNGKRLVISRRESNGMYGTLMADGTWQVFATNVEPDGDVGVFLPVDAWEAICDLAAPHADAGGVKELRAALERAEGRVDQMIEKFLS